MEPATRMTEFPCPICGKYYPPYLVTTTGISKCECPEHGLFETNNKISKNFRRFCSRLGSKPNRSPTYYTSSEKKIKDYLDKKYKEGLDYWHNVRIQYINNDHRSYFWLDFVVPEKKIVLECSPSIWHTRWNRNGADNRKKTLIESLGWRYIQLDEVSLQNIECILEGIL